MLSSFLSPGKISAADEVGDNFCFTLTSYILFIQSITVTLPSQSPTLLVWLVATWIHGKSFDTHTFLYRLEKTPFALYPPFLSDSSVCELCSQISPHLPLSCPRLNWKMTKFIPSRFSEAFFSFPPPVFWSLTFPRLIHSLPLSSLKSGIFFHQQRVLHFDIMKAINTSNYTFAGSFEYSYLWANIALTQEEINWFVMILKKSLIFCLLGFSYNSDGYIRQHQPATS